MDIGNSKNCLGIIIYHLITLCVYTTVYMFSGPPALTKGQELWFWEDGATADRCWGFRGVCVHVSQQPGPVREQYHPHYEPSHTLFRGECIDALQLHSRAVTRRGMTDSMTVLYIYMGPWQCFCFHLFFWDTLIQKRFLIKIMTIHKFRCDLTDVSAIKEPLGYEQIHYTIQSMYDQIALNDVNNPRMNLFNQKRMHFS